MQNDDYIRRRRARCDRQHLQKGQRIRRKRNDRPASYRLHNGAHRLPFGTGSARSRIGADSQNRIFDLMHEVNRITVSKRLGREEVVVPNILNLGVDLIATSNILKDEKKQP